MESRNSKLTMEPWSPRTGSHTAKQTTEVSLRTHTHIYTHTRMHTHTRTHTPSPKLFCVHTHLSPQILNSLPKPNCRQESKGNKLVVRAVMLVSSRIRIVIFESCLCVLESGLSWLCVLESELSSLRVLESELSSLRVLESEFSSLRITESGLSCLSVLESG